MGVSCTALSGLTWPRSLSPLSPLRSGPWPSMPRLSAGGFFAHPFAPLAPKVFLKVASGERVERAAPPDGAAAASGTEDEGSAYIELQDPRPSARAASSARAGCRSEVSMGIGPNSTAEPVGGSPAGGRPYCLLWPRATAG